MIKELNIKNFRRNRKLSSSLDRITIFTGSNAKGKSSTVYALKWVLQDKPKGNRHISWGAKFSEVSIKFGNHILTRRKSNKDNYYDLDGKKYEAFGRTTIPEPIQKVLKIDDINFQHQHDKHYWFSETAGEVNKQLNQIVNLEIIDRTVANLNRRQRENKVKIKDSEGKIKNLRKEVQQLKYIKKLNQDLISLENTENQLKENEYKAVGLANLVDTLSNYRKNIDNLLRFTTDTKELIEKLTPIVDSEEKIERLENLVERAQQYKKIKNKKLPDIQCVIIKQEEYKKVNKQKSKLEDLVWNAKHFNQNITEYKKELKETKEQFDKLMGDRCILCNHKIE